MGRPPSPSKEGGEGGEGREGEAPTRSAADAGGDAEPRVGFVGHYLAHLGRIFDAADEAEAPPAKKKKKKRARAASDA